MTSDISIIICTADKPASLEPTLTSLSFIEIPQGMTAEVIVVDNKPTSSEATVRNASLENFHVRYVPEPQRGKCYALNTGIRSATSEFIAFTDDDLRFPKDWLTNLIQPLVDDEADAVAGAIKIADHIERDWFEFLHRVVFAELLAPQPWGLEMLGANMAFHRRILEKVSSFDENLGPGGLGLMDDSLFSKQVVAAGYRLVFNPKAIVTHHFDETRLLKKNLVDHALRLGRSIGYVDYHWKHDQKSHLSLRKLKKLVQVRIGQFRDRSRRPNDEGCDTKLLQDLMGLGQLEQFERELGKSHKYSAPSA